MTFARYFIPGYGAWLRWFLAAITLWCVIVSVSLAEEPRILTVSEIINLPNEAAVPGMPVIARGTLTYHEPGHRMAFLQDGADAIYVHVAGPQDASPGDFVEVRGFLDPGLNGRNIRGKDFQTSPLIKRLSHAGQPEPFLIDVGKGLENYSGARWIRARVDVESVSLEGDRARLTVKNLPQSPVFIAGVQRASMLPNHLIGLSVELDGVIADSPISEKPLVMQRQLLVPGLPYVRISQETLSRHFELPEAGLADLRWLPERAGPNVATRVLGVVTWCKPGEGFFIQRGTVAAWIQSTVHPSPEVGTCVECSGRPSSYNGAGILNAALWRKSKVSFGGLGTLPVIQEISDSELAHGAKVRFVGSLVEILRGPSEDFAILRMGGDLVFCHCRHDASSPRISDFEKGSQVSVAGVFLNRPSPAIAAADTQGAHHVLMNSGVDMRLVSSPPFWNAGRLMVLLGIVVSVALASILWVHSLRRKVRKQESMIRKTVARQVVEEERVRIAREWHDSFEQHFAGLTMLLDATAAVVQQDSPAGEMLGQAAKMADHSRAEARQAIWDLRTSGIASARPFAEELGESLRQAWPADGSCELRLELGRYAGVLPRSVSLHLLRIANEAVTNALKHARCRTITVSLSGSPSNVCLTITDDGIGMPSNASDQASQEGHFGLLGMRERALRLHGTLEMLSPPPAGTHGTTIRLTIPNPSVNP